MLYGFLIFAGLIGLVILYSQREKLLRRLGKSDAVFPRKGSGPKYPRPRDENDDL